METLEKQASLPTAQDAIAGIRLANPAPAARCELLQRLAELGLERHASVDAVGGERRVTLTEASARALAPESDTTLVAQRLKLRIADNPDDQEREILIAMLASPQPFRFPDARECLASVRVRRHIAEAARRTQLAFHTEEAERPEDCWTYSEETGFIVRPGKPLIEALEKATQPDASGKLYSFSCYRASEYVILLGLARELEQSNPALLDALQRQWERQSIKSGPFHDAFLYEYGSLADPLPHRYYVPGDRLWFRNPDARSSDIAGYEGSWVFYMGGGLFSNFWQRDRPFTLQSKCVEIYHWRHGAKVDAAGELQMDESVVESRVRETFADPEALSAVLARMERLRDGPGVYAEGGCIDASREYPRHILPGNADLPF